MGCQVGRSTVDEGKPIAPSRCMIRAARAEFVGRVRAKRRARRSGTGARGPRDGNQVRPSPACNEKRAQVVARHDVPTLLRARVRAWQRRHARRIVATDKRHGIRLQRPEPMETTAARGHAGRDGRRRTRPFVTAAGSCRIARHCHGNLDGCGLLASASRPVVVAAHALVSRFAQGADRPGRLWTVCGGLPVEGRRGAWS